MERSRDARLTAVPAASRDGRGLGGMLRSLAEDGAHLVRREIALARLEIAAAVHAVGSGTAKVALGATVLLLGLLALITAVVLLAGDQWLSDRYWLAALIVAVLAGGGALFAAARGRSRLEPEVLRPDETTESIKENSEWLKRQLTSAGTSS